MYRKYDNKNTLLSINTKLTPKRYEKAILTVKSASVPPTQELSECIYNFKFKNTGNTILSPERIFLV